MKENNHLIYGKGEVKGLISVEDMKNGFIELFVQDENGNVTSKEVPYEYWILTDSKADELSTLLEGNNEYKYKNSFTTRDDFEYAKKCMKKQYNQKKAFWINDIKEQFMVASGETYYKGLKHKDVSVLSFDIETTGLDHNEDSKVLLISNTFRDAQGNITRKLFAYDEYENDSEMFRAWSMFIYKCDPSIILGHNIYNFDLPYMDYCAEKNNVELNIGRYQKPLRFNSWESKFRKDGSQFIGFNDCHVYGREIIDTMFLSYKYDVSRNFSSYSLKSIIKETGLEQKDRVFYDASQIRKNYKIPEEWTKIKDYCRFDADDALALWDLMGPPYFYMAQSIPKPFQKIGTSASGSQINSLMCRNYLQENLALPKSSDTIQFEGAISFGVPGVYRNVLKTDANSLYPSSMIHYEVFDEKKDPRGYFKEVVKMFTKQRLENKKLAKMSKYHDDMQAGQKIFINSCYGFLATGGLLFNSPKNAAFITEKGREILNKSIEWAKTKFIVSNGDTDSLSYCKKDMSPFSKEEQELLLKEQNGLYPEIIHFEHDGYFKSFVVLAAKNYIMQTYDGKVKIKGSALKSSKLEKALSEFQREIIDIVLDDNDIHKIKNVYSKYVKEIYNVSDIKRWAGKKTITSKIFSSERANETKVKYIIEGTDYRLADKIWTFFKEDGSLCLAENFDGKDYSKKRLLEKLYKTSLVFSSIMDTKSLFPNFGLKKNKALLESILCE